MVLKNKTKIKYVKEKTTLKKKDNSVGLKIKKKTTSLIKKVIKTKIKKKTDKKIIVRKKSNLKKEDGVKLIRSIDNPILKPRQYSWESQASFNPAAIYLNNKIHLFYRALGDDGISRIGYASSNDGINFNERLTYPVFSLKEVEDSKKNWLYTSPARLIFDKIYSSGGGWGGCEDPRIVFIDGYMYMTLNIFSNWNSLRVAVVSIKKENLLNKKWIWENFSYLSHYGDRQKNWVLFPEKINGKFVIFHNLDKGDPNKVFISYVNNLDISETPTIVDAPDPQILPDHIVAWHKRTRSAACPPIRTKDGWLLLYHAMDKEDGDRYKLGAMILDINDPSNVLYRSQEPILEPGEWYENDWKPGIIYANGAILKGNKLFVYYGGGDKYIGVASISVSTLLEYIKKGVNFKIKLENNKKINLQ